MARRALITGATAGIGNAFARELAGRGWNLVLVARDVERLEAVAGELRAKARRGRRRRRCRPGDPEGLARAVNRVTDTSNPVDLVRPTTRARPWRNGSRTTDIADEDRQLDLLVRAPMHLMDAAIKAMSGRAGGWRSRRGGGIINVASVAAFMPRGAYSAHKAWLVNISRWANWHYASSGVTVTAMCPGFVHTEFHQRGNMDVSTVPRWMWLRAEPIVQEAAQGPRARQGRLDPVPALKAVTLLARYAPSSVVARAAKRGR